MTSVQTGLAPEALDTLLVLDPVQIDQLAWEPVPDCPGVYQKTLWRFGDFVHALIRYQTGATTRGCAHLAAHHHIWVVQGAASIGDRRVVAGSYLHVPPGIDHPVHNIGPDGCTVLHLHRPHPPQEAKHLAVRAPQPGA